MQSAAAHAANTLYKLAENNRLSAQMYNKLCFQVGLLWGAQLGNHPLLCCQANKGQRICCTITHFHTHSHFDCFTTGNTLKESASGIGGGRVGLMNDE